MAVHTTLTRFTYRALPSVEQLQQQAFHAGPQVVDYYRKKGAVSDIKAEQDSERVQADIRTVLKDTARS